MAVAKPARRSASSVRSGARDGRLRPGRQGLGRAQVVEIQRARILGALVEVVLELGAGSVSVADVVSRSGVSRRTFYEIFSDREDCFLAAFDDAVARVAGVVVHAFEGEGSWVEGVRAGLGELLGVFDEDPGLGRLLVVESLAVGPRVLERRAEVLAGLIAAVDRGRSQARKGPEPPALTAEGVVGGVCSILYARLLGVPVPVASTSAGPGGRGVGVSVARDGGESFGSLVSLTSSLVAMVVLPFLGHVAAQRELERPVPPARVRVGVRGGGDVFRDLGMRLTYRTLRVLDAIATHPGASNKVLGEVAGINDQGQISKLLWRLQGLRLIDNVTGVSGQGGPNAWRLTEQGQMIHGRLESPRGSVGL
jgi:AcrR family transcriptional regulator